MKTVTHLLQAGKFSEAEARLHSMLEVSPDDIDALYKLASIRRNLGDPAAAFHYLGQAIAIQPDNTRLFFALGNTQLDLAEFEAAEKSFTRATEIDANNVDARNGLSFLDIRQSRFKAAEHSLRITLNVEPENVQAMVLMGVALLEQDKHDEAIEVLQIALKRDAKSSQVHFTLGRALLKAGNAAFAIRCFANASSTDPQNPEFKDWLACAQLTAGQIREAKKNFVAALQMGRVNIEMLMGLVRIETMLGNPNEALRTMSKALELEPERHDLMLQYSEMLMENQRFDEATEQLNRLLKVGFEPSLVNIRLALVLLQIGKMEASLKILEPLRADTSLPSEARLMLTWALQQCNQTDAASEQLEILLSEETPVFEAVLFRARQLYDQGDDSGIELLRGVIARQDIDANQLREAKVLLATSLHGAGDFEAATEVYRELADRKPEVVQMTELYSSQSPASASPGASLESAMDIAVTAMWPTQPPDDNREQPIFVYAWPGSGRVRLLAALDQHPGLMYLPGSPDQQHQRRVRLIDKQGANQLTNMEETNVRLSRRRYWKATGLDGQVPADRKVVDQQRLNAEMLPAIARYFPSTTVIVLTREPRDMAVAWLQAGYKDLESMASQYRQQVEMLEKCRASLPVEFVEIDYDELCDDPEKVLISVQTLLGIQPDDKVVEYFNASSGRSQAHSGDWKNYQDGLSTVFEALG